MNYKIKMNQLTKLMQQRNNTIYMLVGLFMICLIEALSILHLIHFQKIFFTPLPPVVSQPFFVSKNEISASYLADMTRYFALLRLNYTPASLPEQINLLLKYTDSHFFGIFKEQLFNELEQAKSHDISLSFAPVNTKIDEKQRRVVIEGDLTQIIGKMSLPSKRVTYEVVFSYKNGELRVISMKEKGGK